MDGKSPSIYNNAKLKLDIEKLLNSIYEQESGISYVSTNKKTSWVY